MQIQANTGRLCCFKFERVYWFLTSVHGDTRRETQILKVYANHTMLTTQCWRSAHLVMFKISVGRDPKNPSTCLNVWELNSMPQCQKHNSLPPWSNLNWLFFKIPKFSGPFLPGMTSHSSPISCLEVYNGQSAGLQPRSKWIRNLVPLLRSLLY